MTKRTPCFDFPILFTDSSCHWNVLGAVLRWCDTTQGLYFSSSADLMGSCQRRQRAMVYLKECWDSGAVMRSNAVRLYQSHDELKDLRRRAVKISPRLTGVGSTSWRMSYDVAMHDVDCSGSSVHDSSSQTSEIEQGECLLARVETTMVNTDRETFTKPTPLLHANEIKMLLQEYAGVSPPRRRYDFSDPANAANVSRQTMITRVTDCDSLGHINNASYATLAEEARHFAAHRGDFKGVSLCGRPTDLTDAATRPARWCEISYVGQARPFDELSVLTWCEEDDREGPEERAPDVEHPQLVVRMDFFSSGAHASHCRNLQQACQYNATSIATNKRCCKKLHLMPAVGYMLPTGVSFGPCRS